MTTSNDQPTQLGMTWLIRILTFLIGFGALLGVLFLIASIYGWEKLWANTFGPADMGAIHFEDFTKGPKPNQALICPDGICNANSQDRISPIYNISVHKLREELLKALEAETDLSRVDDQSDLLSLRFVQRTPRLRFPDTIRIQLYSLGKNRSTLALYSQSQIGSSDLGVNMSRLKRWLRRMETFELES